jgi:hypothetical protein
MWETLHGGSTVNNQKISGKLACEGSGKYLLKGWIMHVHDHNVKVNMQYIINYFSIIE